jgi:hypothetical protein
VVERERLFHAARAHEHVTDAVVADRKPPPPIGIARIAGGKLRHGGLGLLRGSQGRRVLAEIEQQADKLLQRIIGAKNQRRARFARRQKLLLQLAGALEDATHQRGGNAGAVAELVGEVEHQGVGGLRRGGERARRGRAGPRRCPSAARPRSIAVPQRRRAPAARPPPTRRAAARASAGAIPATAGLPWARRARRRRNPRRRR